VDDNYQTIINELSRLHKLKSSILSDGTKDEINKVLKACGGTASGHDCSNLAGFLMLISSLTLGIMRLEQESMHRHIENLLFVCNLKSQRIRRVLAI